MVLLFQGFFFFVFFFFLWKIPNIYVSMEQKKLSQSNISSSLGELNATEIPLNIIEMFVVRVYFG